MKSPPVLLCIVSTVPVHKKKKPGILQKKIVSMMKFMTDLRIPKVPAACLPFSPRTTPSRTTRVTRTAAAVRVTTLIRRRTCWMNRSRGPQAPPMPTVPLRPRAPCSGQCAPLPASAQPEAPPPAPPPLQVGNNDYFRLDCIIKTSVTPLRALTIAPRLFCPHAEFILSVLYVAWLFFLDVQ